MAAVMAKRWPVILTKVLGLTLVLLIAGFALTQSFLNPDVEGREVSMAEFHRLAQQGRLENLIIHDEDSVAMGTYSTQSGTDQYWMAFPDSEVAFQVVAQTAIDAGARVSINSQHQKHLVRMFATYMLPLTIFLNLFALLGSLIALVVTRRSSPPMLEGVTRV